MGERAVARGLQSQCRSGGSAAAVRDSGWRAAPPRRNAPPPRHAPRRAPRPRDPSDARSVRPASEAHAHTVAQASDAQLQALQAQLASGGMPANPQQAAAAQEKAQQEKQMREDLLTRLVAPDARERLANIMLVKPQKVH